MQDSNITTDEWLAELQRLQDTQPVSANGYMSTQEIMAATGRGRAWVGAVLKKLFEAGRLEVSQRRGLSISGALCVIPTYRIKAAPKKGKAS